MRSDFTIQAESKHPPAKVRMDADLDLGAGQLYNGPPTVKYYAALDPNEPWCSRYNDSI